MHTSLARPLLCLALSAFAPFAHADECRLQVRDAWLRRPPMAMPMLAGFGRIENPCTRALTVAGARSPAFAEVSLHETRVVEGVSRMRALPELRIEPGGAATLQPGGLHLMLMRPHGALRAGQKVAVEFTLKEGGSVRGEFVVREAGE
ncbi:copper chaperone PCu(A)C [Vulcaniibacterium tengchongense]|uniref:Copper(I)-binding protein n=1 Tax=Vulcaniibacterium tengchongense TaxID=1273429 RepID=A0A3N4VBD9_9GAMM|nr:copper chaperone PCu(A)C [Vulcaniibacterium tengchongense]RPE77011.1 hypothetical protein EDC50_2264 [Vulcaniibacterium tengchongense]